MKKILSLMILIIGLTSCLAKVDLEKDTGSLSINIGANTSQKSNISRAISSDTTKIYINLFQPSTHTEITREITYTPGQSYNLTIDNLSEGTWDLHISTYNEISASIQTGAYFDMIEIYKDKDTVVSHKFEAPLKIQNTAPSGQNPEYIDNNEQNITSGYIATLIPENSLMDSNIYVTNVTYLLSDTPDFSRNIQSYSPYISVGMSGQPVTASVGFLDANIIIQANTTYYWKAIVTNNIGTTESKVFSFTTGMP